MVKRTEDGSGIVFDWVYFIRFVWPVIVVVAAGALWVGKYSGEIEANTKFREMAAPRLERMDVIIQRVDQNVLRMIERGGK